MADCELIAKCIFFNDQMTKMPGTAEMFKTSYCKGSNAACARYMVFKACGREKVPANLYPNQHEFATQIISRQSK